MDWYQLLALPTVTQKLYSKTSAKLKLKKQKASVNCIIEFVDSKAQQKKHLEEMVMELCQSS